MAVSDSDIYIYIYSNMILGENKDNFLVKSLFTNKQVRISVIVYVLLNYYVVDCKMIPNSCTTSGFGVNCSTCLPTLLRFVLRIILNSFAR